MNKPSDSADSVALLLSYIKKLALLHTLTDEDLKYYQGFQHLTPFTLSPSHKYDKEIVIEAYQEKFLVINAKIYASDELGLSFLNKKRGAEFQLPAEFKNIEAYIAHLSDNLHILKKHITKREFSVFANELSVNECIGFLEASQKKYNLYFDIGNKSALLFKLALQDYSVAEVISLLWSAFKTALAKIQGRQLTRENAALSVIPNFERLLLTAKEEGWKLTHYWRLKSIPQSKLSKIVFQDVLGLKSDGYNFSNSWLGGLLDSR
uniref:Uncharacterized protein n=1 Tax=Rheinheimera sp. BAL341 TaxID=1708203 RepID=A0A486XH94_9GAMM